MNFQATTTAYLDLIYNQPLTGQQEAQLQEQYLTQLIKAYKKIYPIKQIILYGNQAAFHASLAAQELTPIYHQQLQLPQIMNNQSPIHYEH